jgi:hypothetical protein
MAGTNGSDVQRSEQTSDTIMADLEQLLRSVRNEDTPHNHA